MELVIYISTMEIVLAVKAALARKTLQIATSQRHRKQGNIYMIVRIILRMAGSRTGSENTRKQGNENIWVTFDIRGQNIIMNG